jgi:hypothetical protein
LRVVVAIVVAVLTYMAGSGNRESLALLSHMDVTLLVLNSPKKTFITYRE